MKRWMLSLCLLVCLLLTACAPANQEPRLAPAELTEAETEILELVGIEPAQQIFDFTAPAGTRCILVQSWRLENGEWQYQGGAFEHVEKDGASGRIALNYDAIADGMRVAFQVGREQSATSYFKAETLDVTGLSRMKASLGSPETAVLDKEIPILLQVLTSDTQIATYGLSGFDEPEKYAGHEHVYAVTVTFSSVPYE